MAAWGPSSWGRLNGTDLLPELMAWSRSYGVGTMATMVEVRKPARGGKAVRYHASMSDGMVVVRRPPPPIPVIKTETGGSKQAP